MPANKLEYRTTPIVLSTIFFGVCALWLYFGPPTGGRIGQVLRNGEELSIVGWAAVTIAVIMTALLLPHTLQALLGCPAVENDGERLTIKIFPQKEIQISEIDNIFIGKDKVKIVTKNGYKRTINARLLTDYESFFNSILRDNM